mgnify:CR=1 FL=1
MPLDTKVRDFMTKFEDLVTAPHTTTLKEANDMLPGDADGAAADADLDKVRPGLGQEEEALPVHHVAGR